MNSQALMATVLLATATLAPAQDRPAAAPASPPVQGKVAPPLPARQHVKGTLVAFDVEKATVTFKDEAGKTLSWPVEARFAEHAVGYAEYLLKTLKEGDPIWVVYVVKEGAGPLVYNVRPIRRRSGGGGDSGAVTTPASPTPPR